MQKLTLPVQVGKKYIRRDGKTITVQASHPAKHNCVFIGTGEVHRDRDGYEHAWANTGCIHNLETHPHDLVADAPEVLTYTVEQVLRATEDVTAIELKSRIPAVQKHLDNLADPDYTEFLRLQAKFKN